MPTPAWWRRLRQSFGISAPRMAVRTRLSWPWRAVVVATLVALIGGMWWWGFDFGQLLGGLNRREIQEKVISLEAEVGRLRVEASDQRAKATRLETELAMREGAQSTLSKEVTELQSENSQLREELVFLQKLVADANKQVGLSIQRLAVERVRDDLYRYSMLIVRGGSTSGPFVGNLALQVSVLPPASDGAAARPAVLTLPDEQPDLGGPLKLDFKYYQRVEGSFRVLPGAEVHSVTVRAYEDGHANPRATRSLNLP